MVDNFTYYDSLCIYEKKSMWEQLEGWAEKYKEKVAIIQDDEEITYYEMKNISGKYGKAFLDLGIHQGDNVIVQMPNDREFFYICFGLWAIGAKPILCLPSHRKAELDAIVKIANPSAIIFIEKFLGFDFRDMIMNIANENSCVKIAESNIEVKRKANRICMEKYEFPHVYYGNDALYLLSGGTTTGIPKLIPKIHAAYMYNAQKSAEKCGITQDTVFLVVLPIAHDLPLCNPGALGTFYMGGTVVLAATPSCDDVFPLIDKNKVTNIVLVPAIAEMWLEAIEIGFELDVSTIQTIIIGASRLDIKTAKKIIDVFQCKLQQGYGLGEGVTCFTNLDDTNEISFACQGKPISEYDDIRIVDENNIPVLNGEYGELIEKGPYTFNGYYNSDEINRQLFTTDGFFRTGDCAKITEEGNVMLRGRITEVINKSGEKIVPQELESIIKEYVYIKDVAIVGVVDNNKNQKIFAFLIADKNITVAEVNKFLQTKGLATYKQIDKVVLVDSFPLTNVGKVDKISLKKMEGIYE